MACLLCDSDQATSRRLDGSAFAGTSFPVEKYDCSRCGEYALAGPLRACLEEDEKKQGSDTPFKLACLCQERCLSGKSGVFLYMRECRNTLDQIKKLAPDLPRFEYKEFAETFPKNPIERMDRTLANFSYSHAKLESIRNPGFMHTFSRDQEEVTRLLRLMEEAGYLFSTADDDRHISTKGWNRIAELKEKPPSDSRQAFIAMWFNKEMEQYYSQAIKPAVEECGYDPQKINDVEHNRKICDEIVAEIRRSRFIIADFTGNRGGVYYEAGFAHGLGIPVIFTVKAQDIEDVHFDTNHYNHITYESPEDLFTKLVNRMRATII